MPVNYLPISNVLFAEKEADKEEVQKKKIE